MLQQISKENEHTLKEKVNILEELENDLEILTGWCKAANSIYQKHKTPNVSTKTRAFMLHDELSALIRDSHYKRTNAQNRERIWVEEIPCAYYCLNNENLTSRAHEFSTYVSTNQISEEFSKQLSLFPSIIIKEKLDASDLDDQNPLVIGMKYSNEDKLEEILLVRYNIIKGIEELLWEHLLWTLEEDSNTNKAEKEIEDILEFNIKLDKNNE